MSQRERGESAYSSESYLKRWNSQNLARRGRPQVSPRELEDYFINKTAEATKQGDRDKEEANLQKLIALIDLRNDLSSHIFTVDKLYHDLKYQGLLFEVKDFFEEEIREIGETKAREVKKARASL